MTVLPKGYFKQRYPNLKGRDWVNQLSPEDKAAFLHLVRGQGGHGTKGGRKRADTGKRDNKGRFA